MKSETKIWLEIAQDDFENMKYMWKEKRYRGAALFAQQSVEKILKAYITEYTNKKVIKTHRIERLMKEAQVEELSIAYEWSRYKDLSEEHLKTKRDVKPLIVMAEQLYLWVLQKFKNN